MGKIERILARLDEADEVSKMDLPGYRLHPLKGDRAGFWAVTVRANWRIIFRFEDAHAHDVDLVDYSHPELIEEVLKTRSIATESFMRGGVA